MSSTGQRTHYQVLGITPAASTEEVRRAHRQLARVLHPDRLGAAGAAERRLAERRMREVNVAWTVLSDPRRRSDYDRELAAATGTAPAGRPSAGSSAGPAPRPPASRRPEDDDDPDAAYARARAAEVDPDEPPMGAVQFALLRRAPIVAALVIAAVLFVATAYAGGGGDGGEGDGTASTAADRACVLTPAGEPASRVPCAGTNDGRIVTTVQRGADCPSRTRPVELPGDVVCVTTDPTLLSNTPPEG